MAAGNWTFYNTFKRDLGNGTIDLDTHTFKVILMGSGYTPSASGDAVKADIVANELSTANGYTAGGATLGSVTWTGTSTLTWDCADPAWTASGGAITAAYAVIYDDTPTSPADPLVAYCDLDTGASTVSASDGNSLTIAINASGIFTLA